MKILCFMITPELDNLWEAVHMVYLQQRHMPMSTWGIYESDAGFTVVRVAETERDVETAESMKNATKNAEPSVRWLLAGSLKVMTANGLAPLATSTGRRLSEWYQHLGVHE